MGCIFSEKVKYTNVLYDKCEINQSSTPDDGLVWYVDEHIIACRNYDAISTHVKDLSGERDSLHKRITTVVVDDVHRGVYAVAHGEIIDDRLANKVELFLSEQRENSARLKELDALLAVQKAALNARNDDVHRTRIELMRFRQKMIDEHAK